MWVQSLGWEDPLEKEWQPIPVSLPEKSHGQRSLAAYSPQGPRVEHDRTHMCIWSSEEMPTQRYETVSM